MNFFFSLSRFSRFFSLLVLPAILCAGCIGSGGAIHEYALYPTVAMKKQAAVLDRSIMLMPVSLPSINSSREILLRSDMSVLQPAATRLWAGSLQQQITHILAEDIRRSHAVKIVLQYPGPRFAKPDLLLEVEVTRFDGNMKTGFTCTVLWTVSDNQQKRVLTSQKFSTEIPVNSGNFRGYVAAASEAVGQLAETITRYLKIHDKLSF